MDFQEFEPHPRTVRRLGGRINGLLPCRITKKHFGEAKKRAPEQKNK
jgi:hypothetical protein